jgi:hypothetical protein
MLDTLQQDHHTFTQLLAARRTVSTETMSFGVRVVWQIYLTILEDALTTLTSLIQFLSP